ncbi:hypothetical protein C2S52_008666 [Perilla frutescens var. hirtella]|nr:hypothetical protein C2S51_017628 [Perilla frutescens var. frutescens]KAH6783707.1 hypothetical protein C2S52_008666 [Perilla frutescens var. hirtella]
MIILWISPMNVVHFPVALRWRQEARISGVSPLARSGGAEPPPPLAQRAVRARWRHPPPVRTFQCGDEVRAEMRPQICQHWRRCAGSDLTQVQEPHKIEASGLPRAHR